MSTLLVRPAADPKGWDYFIRQSVEPNDILQSWAWGDFQSHVGRNVIRLEVMDGQERLAQCLLVSHTTKIGKQFLLAPRGPVIKQALHPTVQHELWNQLLQAIADVRPKGTMFLKIEPTVAPPTELRLESGSGIQPQTTLLIDVRQSDEELLAAMHPKTRYNIHVAERKGIIVRWSRRESDVELLLRLLEKTSTHQKIGIHPASYYRYMVETLGDAAEIAIAEYDREAVAGALLLHFGNTSMYLHGGSNYFRREVMGPYALHWQSMQRARTSGKSWYDFYGIAPDDDPDHPWAGITRFKKGFGGQIKKYPGAFNIIYDRRWYVAYRLAKRMAGR